MLETCVKVLEAWLQCCDDALPLVFSFSLFVPEWSSLLELVRAGHRPVRCGRFSGALQPSPQVVQVGRDPMLRSLPGASGTSGRCRR